MQYLDSINNDENNLISAMMKEGTFSYSLFSKKNAYNKEFSEHCKNVFLAPESFFSGKTIKSVDFNRGICYFQPDNSYMSIESLLGYMFIYPRFYVHNFSKLKGWKCFTE